MKRVVVVGGGISGLAAAHALVTGPDPPQVTVLKRSPRLWVGDRIRAIPPTVMGVPVDPSATGEVLGEAGAERVAHEADLAAPALTEDVAIGRFVADR